MASNAPNNDEETSFMRTQTSRSLADEFKKAPLVPMAAAATAIVLAMGAFKSSKGSSAQQSARAMGMRVAAQATTLSLIVGGVMYQALTKPAPAPKSSEAKQA
eukprot:tig00000949_g5721.t1